MSTHDLYEMLTEMVRQGPGHVVAYALGIGSLALFLVSVHWLARRPLQKQLQQLTAENMQLHETRASDGAALEIGRAQNDELLTERTSLAEEAESLRQAKAHLETSLSYTKEEVDRLRTSSESCANENNHLRELKGKLEGQLEDARAECESLRATHATMQEEARRTCERAEQARDGGARAA